MAIDKTKTTLNIDSELLKFIKLKALELDITITDLITLYLKYGLSNHMKIKKQSTEMQYNRYCRKRNK